MADQIPAGSTSPDQPGHPAHPLQRRRFRLHFAKDGPLRFTGHLDLARVWERVLRRAAIPLVYSQGFNPRPHIQLAAALPLGYTSTCEMLDIFVEGEALTSDDLLARIPPACPEGLTILAVEEVPLKSPALQTLTRSAAYLVHPGEPISRADLQARVEALLARESIIRSRGEDRKHYDLRPLIHSLRLLPDDPPALEMTLSLSAEQGTGRPDEVLDELGLAAAAARITRTAIHCDAP